MPKFGSGRGSSKINNKNEDNLMSNCFYVAAAHLLDVTPKKLVDILGQMMPSDNFTGEDLDMIEHICTTSNELQYSTKPPTQKMAKYGIGYVRVKDGSGHCVVVEKGRFLDYQQHGAGENVRNDVEGSKSKILFYFWELGANDEPMDMD